MTAMPPPIGTPAPDFARPVHAVLGLPFDAIDEHQVLEIMRADIAAARRCFLSTPNLNFAIGSLDDEAFRRSVLESDLSIADGWPIVLASRLAGGGISTRATGSGLFERLRMSTHRPPIRVFFLGGPPGAAQAAHDVVNGGDEGVRSAGFDPAGFGSIEAMSSPELLARINTSGADFLLVAMGAKKGQAWIRHNLPRLSVPVISHLGAVVNFVAGTVERAPRWVQRVYGEWLWRIVQEPSLMARYRHDGARMLRLLLRDLLPLAVVTRLRRPSAQALAAARIEVIAGREPRLVLHGAWTEANCRPLRERLQQLVAGGQPIAVDLEQADFVDPAVLGLLMLLHGWHGALGRDWTVDRASPRVTMMIRRSQAGYLLRPQS